MKIKNFIPFLSLMTLLACTHEITPGQIEQGPKTVDENASIIGTVELKDGLKLIGSGNLFIIARAKGKQFGPPLAVKNIPDPILPLNFYLSQDNVMISSNLFMGDITLTARWDKDGNAMTQEEGNISSEIIETHVGDKEIKIVLDKVTND